MTSDPLSLVINAGSSSLKLSVVVGDRVNLRAAVERTNQVAVERRF
jgi:acetate kinase